MRRGRTILGALVCASILRAPEPARAQPLDLASCVQLALRGNPQVQDAADVSVSAALGKRLALSDYDLKIVPKVDGGLQGGNTTNQTYNMLFSRKLLATGAQIEVNGGTNVYSTVPQVTIPYETEARVTLLQPLFQGWSHIERYEHIDDADRRIAAAAHADHAAREDIALRVVHAFYDVVRAGELRAIAERSLQQTTELQNAARAKLEIGAASKMDVYRAELHASRVKATVVDQAAKHDGALDELKALLGLDPRVRFEIDARVQGPAVPPIDEADAIDRASARRIEVIELHDQVTDAERKLWLAKRHLLPEIDFASSYARIGTGNSFNDSLSLNRPEWVVGLRSTFPLDRTPEQVAVSEAEIALRGQERRYRVLREDVAREVRQAMRELRSAEAQVVLAAEVAAQAEQQAELARDRYDKGVTDNFDLVQADEQLAEARGTQVLAAIDKVGAGAVLLHATGELVDAFVGPASPRVPSGGDQDPRPESPSPAAPPPAPHGPAPEEARALPLSSATFVADVTPPSPTEAEVAAEPVEAKAVPAHRSGSTRRRGEHKRKPSSAPVRASAKKAPPGDG